MVVYCNYYVLFEIKNPEIALIVLYPDLDIEPFKRESELYIFVYKSIKQ